MFRELLVLLLIMQMNYRGYNVKIGYVIDSTINVSNDYKENNNILVANLKIMHKGIEKPNITNDEIINALKKDERIMTSQPTPGEFLSYYEKHFEKGFDKVVCFTISKTLSGSFNSANLAKDMLDIKKDDVLVVDTMSVDGGSVYILEKFIEFFNKFNDFDKTVEKINNLIETGALYFLVDDLKTIKINGRLGSVKYFIAKMLRIKPILKFMTGKLSVYKSAVLGHVRAKKTIFARFLEIINENKEKNITIFQKQILNDEKSDEFFKSLQEELKDFKNVKIENRGLITPVICSHIGPGGLGFYINYE